MEQSLLRRGGGTLAYFEDLPYATWTECVGWANLLPDDYISEIHCCSAKAWAAKQKAIIAYSSQIPVFADDFSNMERYALELGNNSPAEEIWIEARRA